MNEKSGFEDERFGDKSICFTKRDEILKKCISNFKKNLPQDFLINALKIGEEEKEKRKIEFDKIYKEYKEFDFLEQNTIFDLIYMEMLNFSDYIISSKNAENLDVILLKEISVKSSLLMYTLIFFYDLLFLLHKNCFHKEQKKHDYIFQKMVKSLTIEFSKSCDNHLDLGFDKIKFSPDNYLEILKSKNIQESFLSFLNIIEKDFLEKFEKNELPFVIRENFFLRQTKKETIKKTETPAKKIKLCFLVHGLEGSSNDLRVVRSVLQYYCADIVFLLSEENEDDTRDNIKNMGKRLAREITAYIEFYTDKENLEISLIGHSLGGLIIRASLPYLSNYSRFFKTLITLATPHLGCSPSSILVSTGMKVLSKFKEQKSLREMCFEDKERFLLQLSKKEGLNWFENIVFICAVNDGYVNLQSAKILFENFLKDKDMQIEMIKNIYGKLESCKVIKIGTFVPNVNKGFNYFLGREAHIDILNNHFLLHLVFSQIIEYL